MILNHENVHLVSPKQVLALENYSRVGLDDTRDTFTHFTLVVNYLNG